jgi:hypothetical protein
MVSAYGITVSYAARCQGEIIGELARAKPRNCIRFSNAPFDQLRNLGQVQCEVHNLCSLDHLAFSRI